MLGDALPGGRWLAVHLFTLGVLTNLLADLTRHFSSALLHAPGDAAHPVLRIAARNAGMLAVLAGRVNGAGALVAAGAAVVSAEVLLGWRDIRAMRRRALPARHAPLVRAYQRAHGAFLHAALLGALLGTGAVSGGWYANVRLAHLHVAVLGWVGAPLLATLVFLGPTLLRARSAPAADVHARRFLPVAATGATVASLALIPGWRLVAAAGVAAFAVAATVVCRDVLAVRPAAPSPAIPAALTWLVVAAWADAALLVTGRTAYLDAVGAMALLGGVAPLVVVSAGYLWAMSGGADAAARAARLRAVARWSTARAVLWHGGAAVLVATVVVRAAGADAPGPSRLGLYLVAASGALSLLLPVLRRT